MICGDGELLALVSRGPAIGGPKAAVRYSKSPVLGLESSSQSWNILEVINMLIIVDEEANNSGHFLTSAGWVSTRTRIHRCVPVVGTE